MKRALVVTFVLFFCCLIGIFAWYVAHTRRINAELEKFVADAQNRKMVKVTFAVAAPQNTPKDQMLYLSGSVPALGNWDAAGVPLVRRDDGRYVATAEVQSGIPYSYKITRGTWGTVESDPNGKPTENRALEVTGDTATIDVRVAGWLDGGKTVPGRVTTSGNIVLHKKCPSKHLPLDRTLAVYLPPNYEQDKDARFPVLYMQDGQNLFDESTSFQGIEWRMDEAAQALIAQGVIRPVIIVGIYNTEQRDAEFTPPWASGGKPARGDDYAKLVLEEVKPFIEKTYRTAPGRENAAIGGASMGALIAMHVVKTSPQTFGQLALISPWLRAGGKPIAADWIGDGKWLAGTKLYIEMGTAGGANYPGDNGPADAKDFVQKLQSAGVTSVQYNEIPGDQHNEASWQRHVDEILTALFAAEAPATQPTDATAAAP